MATVEELKLLLEEALNKEKMAQENCQLILESLKVNGFYDQIEKIEDDEARHQIMVRELLKLLS